MNFLGLNVTSNRRQRQLEAARRKGQVEATTVQPRAPRSEQSIRGLQWHPSRMPINPVVYTMDREFIGHRRQLAWNTVRDIEQNLSLMGWMIRQHIIYTSQFQFQPRTPDAVFNRELRQWFHQRTTAEKIDVQRRFSFNEMFSTWAGLIQFDGYSLILKSVGGRLQLFEAWNIARGSGADGDERAYGVTINKDGIVLDDCNAIDWVAIATGDTSGTLTHRYLAFHDECILDGVSARAANTLWESPILSVIDKCRDYLSADEYNLMKAKFHAMFVVARYMDNEQKGGADFPMRSGIGGFPSAEANNPQEQDNKPVPPPPPLSEVRSGMIFNMNKDERMEFLESKTPSTEYVNFIQKVVRDILLVEDIPYSFYDSEKANYSSMKADSVRYSNSCWPKREKNAGNQRKAIGHVLNAGLAEDMPMWSGRYTVDTLPFALVPRAPYILDPAKELPATVTKLNACLTDHQTACDEMGAGDFYDIIDRRSEQLKYAKEKGVPIILGTPSIRLTGEADVEEQPVQPEPEGRPPTP